MPSKPEKANADRRRRYYEQHERELARKKAADLVAAIRASRPERRQAA